MKKITVLYKSGNKMTFKTENLKVVLGGEGISSATWDAVDKNSPYPLFFGVDNVEAIWYES